MVCGFVLSPTIVRIPCRDYRLYKPDSVRSDGKAFVLWNPVTLVVTHARVGGSDVVSRLGGVRNRNLVLGESNPSDITVWVPGNVFTLSQAVCE